VTGLSFSPDGAQLASYGADGVVRIWALDLDELVALARHQVTRDLNDDECHRYLHTARCAVLPAPND
jgi:WD40 repeat protein